MNLSIKTKLLFIAITFLGLSQANARAETTHYQALKQMFEQADRASLSDLEASYAGRCFYNRALVNMGHGGTTGQDDATGSILIGRLVANTIVNPGQDGGPHFPPPAAPAPYVIAEVSTGAENQRDGTHYRFDDWTNYQAQQMLNYSVALGAQLFPVSDSGQDITWHEDYNRSAGPHVNNTVRISGDYLVLHAIEVAQGNQANPQIDFYCYFYKQLE